jgi:hypothetical protein
MLAGVVLRLGDHGLDRRRLAAPCPAPRRAENIAPRAGRAAIAFGDACNRRCSRRRLRRRFRDRAIPLGEPRSRPIPLHREGRDLDSWGNCSGRFAAPSAPIARRFADLAHFVDRAHSVESSIAHCAHLSGGATKTREEDSHPRKPVSAMAGVRADTSGASGITSRKNGVAQRSKLGDAHRWPTYTSEP